MGAFPKRFVLAMLAIGALAGACSDSDPADPTTPAVNENTLVFTRANQSTITFANGTQLFVWCGPWEAGLIPAPAVHVYFFGQGSTAPGWQLNAVVADVKIGTPLTFPNDFIFDKPKNAEIFILDPPNELSSSRAQSSGSVTFQQLNCAAGGRVTFTIAATIASEFGDGAPVSVSGKLSAPVGQAPF